MVLGETDRGGQQVTQQMRNLRGTPEGQRLTCLAVLGDNAARLHGTGSQSLIDQPCFDNDTTISLGLLEDLIDGIRWWMHTEGHVGLELLIEQWCIRLHGFLNVNHGWEWLIIDFNHVSCIADRIAVFCDDDGHRVAIETHLALGEWAMDTHAVSNVSQRNSNRNIAHYSFEVLSGVDSENARMGAGSLSIDTGNTSMPIGTTEDGHMDHARQFDVVNVGRLTSN